MLNFLRRKKYVVIVVQRREQMYYHENGHSVRKKEYATRFKEEDAKALAAWLNTLGVAAVAIEY